MSKIPFNVSAKTARLIGRENVSNLEGAIIELIKNTYDADATKCILYFEESTQKLFIIDNGIGMSEATIIDNWMTIGNSSKLKDLKTKSGRVNTGEKGIGRFALDRISSNCLMYTNNKKEKIEWSVNWDSFDTSDLITETYAEINESKVSLIEFSQRIKNAELKKLLERYFTNSGTCFELSNLRDIWNSTNIQKIHDSLEKLLPPIDNDYFSIYLFTEQSSIKESKIKPLLINDFDYKIKFSITKDNHVDIKLYRNEFDFGSKFDSIIKKGNFTKEDIDYFKGKPKIIHQSIKDLLPGLKEYTIGQFSGEIIFFKLKIQEINKEKYFYKSFSCNRASLKEVSGIKIYRDDFLVRPYGLYGTTGYDWLDLSGRKSDSPAAAKTDGWRVDSNQICGQIKISRLNSTLPDKSSREGILETPDFEIFKEIIISVIEKIEIDRHYVISKLDKIYTENVQGEKALKLAKEHIKKVETQKSKNKQKTDSDTTNDETYSTFKKAIDYQESQINDLQEEMGLLRTLATTGIVVNTYIHEIKSLTTLLNVGVKDSLKALQQENDQMKAINKLKEIRTLKDRFSSWFKVTLDAVQLDKRSRKKENISILIKKLIDNWNLAFVKEKINCIFSADEDICIRCFPFDFETIINNLVTNSYSKFDLSSSQEREIKVQLLKEKEYFVLHYQDNGKGLSESYKKDPDQILRYGVTDKRDENNRKIGTGVGLWIVNNIIKSYNGYIDLSKNEKNNIGFYIDLYFKARED